MVSRCVPIYVTGQNAWEPTRGGVDWHCRMIVQATPLMSPFLLLLPLRLRAWFFFLKHSAYTAIPKKDKFTASSRYPRIPSRDHWYPATSATGPYAPGGGCGENCCHGIAPVHCGCASTIRQCTGCHQPHPGSCHSARSLSVAWCTSAAATCRACPSFSGGRPACARSRPPEGCTPWPSQYAERSCDLSHTARPKVSTPSAKVGPGPEHEQKCTWMAVPQG